MKYNLKPFGKRIVLRRKELKISQKKLAEQIHISNNHLSSIENGKAMPSFGTFLDICVALHVHADYLISGLVAADLDAQLIDKLKLCSVEDRILLSKIVDVFLPGMPES